MSDDWRLKGYKGIFSGKKFTFQEFHSSSKNDHEHCEFCWKKITDLSIEETEKSGYVYYDEKSKQSHWICQSCFNEFKEKLDLKTNDCFDSK